MPLNTKRWFFFFFSFYWFYFLWKYFLFANFYFLSSYHLNEKCLLGKCTLANVRIFFFSFEIPGFLFIGFTEKYLVTTLIKMGRAKKQTSLCLKMFCLWAYYFGGEKYSRWYVVKNASSNSKKNPESCA